MQVTTEQARQRGSEMIRIAEERHRAWLHDTVLQVLEYMAAGGYGACSTAEQLRQVASRAADELRATIDGDDAPRQRPFVEELRAVVDEASALSDIDLRLDLDRVEEPVDPVVGAEIVSVVREALNNTRKHSGASAAVVECIARNQRVEVRVVDDGNGFDPLKVREGLGIRRSMRQRMARCGGSIAIASAPGRGVVVRITSDTTNPRITESVA